MEDRDRDNVGGGNGISDEDCLVGLRLLRKRSAKKLHRAETQGWQADQITEFELEVDALDRAISLVSGHRGLREDGKVSVGFTHGELLELVNLIDDEDDLDEALLTQLRKRLDRARKRIGQLVPA